MIQIGKFFAVKALGGPSSSSEEEVGSVFQTIRRPDGSWAVVLRRDVHERALSRAKSVLTHR